MYQGEIDNHGEFYRQCSSYINQSWILSQEPNDKIPIDTIIIAWTNTVEISNTIIINGVQPEKQIVIPTSQKYHLLQHLDYINWPIGEANQVYIHSFLPFCCSSICNFVNLIFSCSYFMLAMQYNIEFTMFSRYICNVFFL